MSLIEVLVLYRNMIRNYNRKTANVWLMSSCSFIHREAIVNSVSDKGEFISSNKEILEQL